MDELLSNPAIQAGVAPLLVALCVAAVLHRTRLSGLAVVAAFATVIALTVGHSYEVLTAVRKLILVGLASGLVLAFLEWRGAAASAPTRRVLAAAAGAGAVWVVWRVLQQQDTAKAVVYGAAAALYAALLVEASVRAAPNVISAAAASLILGLAAGILAILGASALLGLMGVATAAGAAAVLLVQIISSRRAPAGWTVALPGAVIAGLVGLLADFTGSLPWFCLLPTLAIPWATRLFAPSRHSVWVTAAAAVAGVIPAGVAIGLAWFMSASTA